MREIEVQQAIVLWFRNQRYEVFEEISGPAGNRVDIIASQGEKKWIIEVKGDYDDPSQYY